MSLESRAAFIVSSFLNNGLPRDSESKGGVGIAITASFVIVCVVGNIVAFPASWMVRQVVCVTCLLVLFIFKTWCFVNRNLRVMNLDRYG